MTAHDHREYVEGCFRCDLSRAETAPDVAGIEAALADVLAAHAAIPLVESGGILIGFGCPAPCSWGNEGGYDMVAHRAHVAAALLPVVTQAQAEAWDAGRAAGHRELKPVNAFGDTESAHNPHRARADESGA